LEPNTTTRYIPDYTTGLPPMLSDGTTNIVYGVGSERLQAVTAGTATWFTHDHLGSTRQTVTNSGTVAGSARYDAWGVPVENTTGSRFGFTGELTDNGLVYLRARWYNPATGVFLSRDPFPGVDTVPQSLHPYAYTHNNPVNHTDPSGRCIDERIPVIGEDGCRVEAGVMRGNLDWVGTRDYLWNVFQGMGLPGAMIADAFTGGHATQRIVAEGGIGTRLGAVFTGVALGGAAWRYGPAAWRAANDALSATMIRGQRWLTQNPSAARWLLGATGLAGRSSHGSNNGIINEDRLGLDMIYIQTERWENTAYSASKGTTMRVLACMEAMVGAVNGASTGVGARCWSGYL
jgi:RHS repeat-associated protein